MNLNVVDLFCGAGGMSYGFREAGFNIVCGLDFNKEAIESFKHNFPEAVAIHEDICNISSQELLNKIDLDSENVDVIIGGPPCQGYSHAGKRLVDDPRNYLFKEFVRIVNDIQPKVFVMENVVGLVTMANGEFKRQIEDIFDEIGYTVNCQIVNCADYGVPQERHRTIFLGLSKDLGEEITFPDKTHFRDRNPYYTTVGEAISDLPLLSNTFGMDKLLYTPNPVSSYQFYMMGLIDYFSFLLGRVCVIERIELIDIYNHWTSKSKEETIHKFTHIEQGQNWSALPTELKTKGVFSNLYKRLHLEEPSITLTNIRKSMFIHPIENRLLTVREGARIQGFHDDFVFKGTLNSQQQQIGNAVPPILGCVLALHIMKYI